MLGLLGARAVGLAGPRLVEVCAFRRVPLAGVGCRDSGRGSGVYRGCFRLGKKYFRAAYYLYDECHIFNIFRMMTWGE